MSSTPSGQIAGLEKPVSRLVQGAMALSRATRDRDFEFLDAVWEMGCNTFDTAHVYGQGESEWTLGLWLAEREFRDKAVVITKGAHPASDNKPRVTPVDISRDLTESLDRLQVPTVDIYLLHRDDPHTPVGPIIEELNEHWRAGRISVFGASNWSHSRIREANEYAAARGLTPFTLSSPNLSLAEQVAPPWPGSVSIAGEAGRTARAWYAQHQIPILAWSSLAGGFFSGRFHRDNLDAFTDYFDKSTVESYCVEANFARLERAEELANTKGVGLTQIALAYVLNQPLDVFALVGSRTPEEYASNADACAISLTPIELSWLENG